MRLLLVNVSRPTEVRIPQGLLYLASAVHEAGHRVTIFDEALAENPRQFLDEILNFDAQIIGLSVYWHATLYPKASILNKDVDVVVRGPGEKPLCQLLNVFEHKQLWNSIPGLVIKNDGKVVETGPECLSPEYLYPPLNFQLIDLDAYLRHHDAGTGILQYITSRGCYGKCSFCVMSRLFQGRLIRKPQNQIVAELKSLLQSNKITAIRFSDDNAFTNNTGALKLCDMVSFVTNGKGVSWRCPTRIDTLSRLTSDTYEKLIASGCQGFAVGVESGVNRVLQLMKKGTQVSQIDKALSALKENKIECNLFFFLFGFTGETEKEAQKTLALARKVRLMFPSSDIVLYVYFPLMSDSSWLKPHITASMASHLSDAFADYYDAHLKNYRVAKVKIQVLRYYFGASKIHENKPAGSIYALKIIYRKLLLLRLKYGVFVLPFEYYLSLSVLKKIKHTMTWVKKLKKVLTKESPKNDKNTL